MIDFSNDIFGPADGIALRHRRSRRLLDFISVSRGYPLPRNITRPRISLPPLGEGRFEVLLPKGCLNHW